MREDVLRLDVSVDHIQLMQVFHSLPDLLHIFLGIFLR